MKYEASQKDYQLSDGTQSHSMAAVEPLQKDENPLTNPGARKKLVGLEDRLNANVFGQEDATKMAARAIRNRAIDPSLKNPAVMLLLGSTGTGKTELGKTIAQEVYGSRDRMQTFDMGEVKWEGDFNKIFGSPPGFVGSDKIPPFEKFLQNFPEGGAIVFDEIGNMGGGSASREGQSFILKQRRHAEAILPDVVG